MHQPGVSVLWSHFYCDLSKLIYALHVFRFLYTFPISHLSLYFEVRKAFWYWSPASEHMLTYTYDPASHIETSPYQHPHKYTALKKSTGCPVLFLLSNWLGLKSTSGKYACAFYILYKYKNAFWIIRVAGQSFPGLSTCWYPDMLGVEFHLPALVADTATSYPTFLQVHLEAH